MAKRVTKKATPKKKTTKKAPPKKAQATSGKKKAPKKATTAKKKPAPKKATVTSGKKKTTKKKLVLKKVTPPKPLEEIKTTRKKPVRKSSEDKFIRVSENAKSSRFHEMGQRVQAGELKWSYYAVDGNVGYHYYLKLKDD